MRSFVFVALAATGVSSFVLPWSQATLNQQHPFADATPEKFLIELSPGETKWVTEDEKWDLRRVGSTMAPSND